jgi:hypothetical protein
MRWNRSRMFERANAACVLAGALALSGCVGASNYRTPDSTPPGRSFPGCSVGQERVCINSCKAVVEAGVECTNDPCDRSPRGVCDSLFKCVPNDRAHPSFGTCQPITAVYCNTGSVGHPVDNNCAAGLSCLPFHCKNQQSPIPSRYDGGCFLPAREGEPCNQCNPCEPGTSCELRPGDRDRRICRRVCASNSECVDGDSCRTMLSPPGRGPVCCSDTTDVGGVSFCR